MLSKVVMQKKLMLLGGIRYLLPVIKAAHEQGYYVITADYLPDNIAHKYSDEYVNVSIIDKEAVLKVAREKQIDGIMSFGVDPGVITASYVQNQMGLPSFGPYESVCILQNKDKFRDFLAKNGFNVPKAKGYTTYEDSIIDIDWYQWPVIVKPVDSAASKGVTRVDVKEKLKDAVEYALQYSSSGRFIIEEFIEKVGCSSDSDCFSINGKLEVITYSAQRFDDNAENPYAPAGFSWPSTFTKEQEDFLTSELQRLLNLLGMNTTIYNIESRVGKDGKPYIMEVSPRGGGNRLAEMVRFSTGADMITAAVRAAVGDSVEIEQKALRGHWAEVIIHSEKTGEFKEIVIEKDFHNSYVHHTDLWVSRGDKVEAFTGGNKAIGTIVLSFDEEKTMLWALGNQKEWLKVVVS